MPISICISHWHWRCWTWQRWNVRDTPALWMNTMFHANAKAERYSPNIYILSNCLSFTLSRCNVCVCVFGVSGVCNVCMAGLLFLAATHLLTGHIQATLCSCQTCVLIHVYWLLIATVSIHHIQSGSI